MTIGGAIAELQNLINADDVPFYYKGGIEKVIETILMELPTIEVSEDCISRECVNLVHRRRAFKKSKREML